MHIPTHKIKFAGVELSSQKKTSVWEEEGDDIPSDIDVEKTLERRQVC